MYILDGLRHGFRIVSSNADPIPAAVNNYNSAISNSNHSLVEKQTESELLHGNYCILNKQPAIVSAIGAIPKPGSSKIRLIHDCSRPSGLAVNDYASAYKFRYQSLDDAVALVRPGCFLAKVDLRAAYRSVPVHPDCYPFLGLKWQFSGEPVETVLYDSKLCFGAKLAPGIFNRITLAVHRMLLRRGIQAVIYLDDFLLVSPSFEECVSALNVTVSLLSQLGFYIAWEKIEGPAQRLIFLGVLIDSLAMRLELPEKKLNDLSLLLDTVAGRQRISKRQLDMLIGKLVWAARVVRGGRTFVRRLIDTSMRLKQPNHRICTRGPFMRDISFWRNFLAQFNGKALLIQRRVTDLSTDACPIAWGTVYQGDWAYGTWAAEMPEADNLSINHKEVLALLFAARRWRGLWRGAQVVWHTDNVCAAAWLNRGSCRSPVVMKAIRDLFWLSVMNDFQIIAHYLPGVQNWASDAVSRLHELPKHRRWLPLCSVLTDVCVCSPVPVRYWPFAQRSGCPKPPGRLLGGNDPPGLPNYSRNVPTTEAADFATAPAKTAQSAESIIPARHSPLGGYSAQLVGAFAQGQSDYSWEVRPLHSSVPWRFRPCNHWDIHPAKANKDCAFSRTSPKGLRPKTGPQSSFVSSDSNFSSFC